MIAPATDPSPAAAVPEPFGEPFTRLHELLETGKHTAEKKLADLTIKLAAHRAQEDAARIHLESLIVSTSACQELFDAVEEDCRHVALCTALAEEARGESSRKRPREAEEGHEHLTEAQEGGHGQQQEDIIQDSEADNEEEYDEAQESFVLHGQDQQETQSSTAVSSQGEAVETEGEALGRGCRKKRTEPRPHPK